MCLLCSSCCVTVFPSTPVILIICKQVPRAAFSLERTFGALTCLASLVVISVLHIVADVGFPIGLHIRCQLKCCRVTGEKHRPTELGPMFII